MTQPVYVVFAGVNGAGKSTFFRTGLWRQPDFGRSMVRVNPDEILREAKGDPALVRDQIASGKEALRRIDDCLGSRRSFNQETTLTGHMSIRTIKRAYELGYRVVVYYMGLASCELALERIDHRVQLGGHPIDADAVRRRYRASIGNLSKVLDYCEMVTVYDNTTEFVAVAQWSCGSLCWVGDVARRASWLLEAMQDETLWRAR